MIEKSLSIPNNKSSKVSVVNHFFGPIYPPIKIDITPSATRKLKKTLHPLLAPVIKLKNASSLIVIP
jgi:hypothetical protein